MLFRSEAKKLHTYGTTFSMVKAMLKAEANSEKECTVFYEKLAEDIMLYTSFLESCHAFVIECELMDSAEDLFLVYCRPSLPYRGGVQETVIASMTYYRGVVKDA